MDVLGLLYCTLFRGRGVFVYGALIIIDVLVVSIHVHFSGGLFVHGADIFMDVLGL